MFETRLLIARRMLATLLAACAGGGVSTAADWPQWRGPRRDGVSLETGWSANWPPAGPKVLWKANVGEGFSGTAVVGERLYTMGFTRQKGVKPTGMAKDPGLDHVWCLDAATGKVIWEHSYRCRKGYYYGPFGTPTVAGGRVYTLGKYGHLFCLDASSGKVVWGQNVATALKAKVPYYGYACMPVVVGDLLILNVGHPGPSMAALDRHTGRLVWKSGRCEAGYSSPVAYEAAGGPAVTILTPRAAVGLDAKTGRQLWSHPWKTGPQSSATTPLVSGTRVFVSASENKQWCALLEIGGEAAKVVWENRNMMNYFNAPVLWKGCLYGIHSTDHVSKNSSLRCVEFDTGKVKWDTGGVGKGGVTVAGGRLIVLCEGGELRIAEASPDRYVELARAKVLDGKCWTPAVLCRGRIYCRNHKGTVVCLDVGGGKSGAD